MIKETTVHDQNNPNDWIRHLKEWIRENNIAKYHLPLRQTFKSNNYVYV